MALIDQIKNCVLCNKDYSPKKGVSYKQWSNSKYCSRQCFGISIRGQKITEEHKVKISEGLMGRKVSKETKEKISLSNTGKKRTPEMIKNISEAHKGIPSPIKGKKLPERCGANHWAWLEDRTQLVKSEKKHLDGRYREWMRDVKNRDNWSCRIADDKCNGRLEAHHILRWAKFPELRYEVNNGITLCHFHHPRKINDEMNLAPIFQELVKAQ